MGNGPRLGVGSRLGLPSRAFPQRSSGAAGLFELGVDDVAFAALAAGSGAATGGAIAVSAVGAWAACPGAASACSLVELAGHGVGFFLELLEDAGGLGVVLLLDGFTPFLDQGLDLAEIDALELVLVLGDLLLDRKSVGRER